jgi:hypothetical protein
LRFAWCHTKYSPVRVRRMRWKFGVAAVIFAPGLGEGTTAKVCARDNGNGC